MKPVLKQVNVRLTGAQRRALNILKGFGDIESASDLTAGAIEALWHDRFPKIPLGRDPFKKGHQAEPDFSE